MSSLQAIIDWVFAQPATTQLGWVLLHSVWQLTLIAIVAITLGRYLRHQSANLRYCLYSSALVLVVIAPIVTHLVRGPDYLITPVAKTDARFDPIEPTQQATADSTRAKNQTQAGDNQSEASGLERPADATAITLNKAPPLTKVGSERIQESQWLQYSFKFMVAFWYVGVCVFSLRLLGSAITIGRLKRVGTLPVSNNVTSSLSELCTRMKINRPVEIHVSSLIDSPIVVGCFRSLILVPSSLISSVSASELEAILAHEAAHVRRYDYLVNLLQTIIETLVFYHPAVWMISNRIRLERENCCDDLAIKAVGDSLIYSRALLAIEEQKSRSTQLSLAATGGDFMARLHRILHLPAPLPSPLQRANSALVSLGVLAGSMLVAGITFNLANAHPGSTSGNHEIEAPFRLPDHWILEDVRWINQDQELITVSLQGGVDVRRWDVAEKKLLSEIKLQSDKHGRPIIQGTLKLSPDGTRVLGVTDEFFGIWDSASGKLIKQLKIPQKDWSYDTVRCFDCSSDGSIVVAGLQTGYELTSMAYPSFGIVWNAESGEEICRFEQKAGENFRDIQLSEDGEFFVTCTRMNRVGFWKTNTGELLHDFTKTANDWQSPAPEIIKNNLIYSVALSSNNKLLAISGSFGIRLVDVPNESLVRTIDTPCRFGRSDIVFSSNDQFLASTSTRSHEDEKDKVRVWSVMTGETITEIESPGEVVRFSDDGAALAVAESDFFEALSVWPAKKPKQQGPLPEPEKYDRIDRVEENTHTKRRAAEFAERWNPTWGPAQDGLQYGLALTTDSHQFATGEKIRMVAFLKNSGQKPIQIDFRPDMFGNPIRIQNEAGDLVPIEYLKLLGKPSLYREDLKPGEIFGPLYLNVGLGSDEAHQEQVWTPYWPSPKSGKYNAIHRVNVNIANPNASSTVSEPDWKSTTLDSGSISIEIAR